MLRVICVIGGGYYDVPVGKRSSVAVLHHVQQWGRVGTNGGSPLITWAIGQVSHPDDVLAEPEQPLPVLVYDSRIEGQKTTARAIKERRKKWRHRQEEAAALAGGG